METVEYLPMSKTEKETLINDTVTNYRSKLMAFIRPKVKNNEDAEDILQEVWYQFSNVTNLSEIINVGSWLYRVTANKITDSYRKKKTENLEDFTYENDDGEISIKDILLLDSAADPEMQWFQEEIMVQLYQALEELPEKQRTVYVENELQDKTLQQIADEQGENLKTIISRKQYAVKHLRKRLRSIYNELLD